MKEVGLSSTISVSQLCVRLNIERKIVLLICKLIDNFLITEDENIARTSFFNSEHDSTSAK